jgi:hypothetical protein
MRAMKLGMAGLSQDEIVIYLDEIMVFSENLEEYILRLEKILSKP